MDPAHSIIYVAIAEDKAPALPIRLLRFLPLAWFILEVVVLIEVGQEIGALATVGLLLLAAVLGSLLIRHAGLSVLASMVGPDPGGRTTLERMQAAGWKVAAGFLLILPGFASDVVALLLCLPPVRRLLAGLLPQPRVARRSVIEGEFHEVEPVPDGTLAPPPGDGPHPAGPEDRPRNPWSGPGPRPGPGG